MELKEYIKIIKQNRKLFFAVWVAVVVAAAAVAITRPLSHDVSMAINISRVGVQETADYHYDQYYRMEADGKYADTVSQWLKDPQVSYAIYSKSEVPLGAKTIRSISKTFSADKLAPNYIQVRFSAARKEDGQRIARSVEEVISQKNEELNNLAQDKQWFALTFDHPIIVDKKVNVLMVLAISAVGGFILSVAMVLLAHYWKED